MDAGLRKRHKYIWLLLTAILSVLLVIVIKGLNFNNEEKLGNTSEVIANAVKEANHDLLDVFILEKDGSYVLKLHVKQPIKSASSVIFTLDENQEIGQLEGVGSYTFYLKNKIKGIIIKDVIKNQEILKLEF